MSILANSVDTRSTTPVTTAMLAAEIERHEDYQNQDIRRNKKDEDESFTRGCIILLCNSSSVLFKFLEDNGS